MIRPTVDERLSGIVVGCRRRKPRRRPSSGPAADTYAAAPNTMSAAR